MKRYGLDKTAAAMFPKTDGAWVKLSDVLMALELAKDCIMAERDLTVEAYHDIGGKVTDAGALKSIARCDAALAAIGNLEHTHGARA